MAEVAAEPIVIDGRLVGVEIIGANIGDELREHSHTQADIHWSIVTKGSFELFGRPEIEGRIVRAGNMINWRVGEVHGARALESDSRMANILKRVP